MKNSNFPSEAVSDLFVGSAFAVKDQWSFGGRYPVMLSRIPMGPKLFDEGVLTVPGSDAVKQVHPDTDISIAMNMGLTAEAIAKEFDISRQDMDEYAYRSHQRTAKAQSDGSFAESIVSIHNGKRTSLLEVDANIRTDTSVEKLQTLRPVFSEKGRVGAGNSSPLTSGAALLTLMSDEAVEDYKVESVVRLVTACIVREYSSNTAKQPDCK